MVTFLDPAILFFVFGLFAGLVRSNLEIPQPIARFLSLYLLMALGLKGGFALQKASEARRCGLRRAGHQASHTLKPGTNNGIGDCGSHGLAKRLGHVIRNARWRHNADKGGGFVTGHAGLGRGGQFRRLRQPG